MSTESNFVDVSRFQGVLSKIRSDEINVNRKAWCIVNHVNKNPHLIDIFEHDASADATVEQMVSQLNDEHISYCLLRLITTFDMSVTVKFVYIHWIGEKVPFVAKGRFGVVHGSVKNYFAPFHLFLETSSREDLTEANIIKRLEESSGTINKVLEGPMLDHHQERGFTAHSTKTTNRVEPRSVAPAGVIVQATPELELAMHNVRRDDAATNWVLATFKSGDIKQPLDVQAEGEGSILELTPLFDDQLVQFALLRSSDLYDDIPTVKFVYIYWIGEKVKPLTKGKLSAYAGPIEKLFSPAHITMSFSSRSDIKESVIKDKIMASSGSKLFVK